MNSITKNFLAWRQRSTWKSTPETSQPKERSKKMSTKIGGIRAIRLPHWSRLVVPIGLLILWECSSRLGWVSSSLLPAASRVIDTLGSWVFGFDDSAGDYTAHWLTDAQASVYRVLLGYLIAVVSATTLGIAIGWWRWVERSIEPTLQLLRPIPPVSWIPLAIIWFGIADKPAIFLVFLAAFFPILLNTIHGVKACDRNLIRAAQMMGATQGQMLRYVIVPAALPSIFSGMRISIGIAWMLTVTAEMVAVKSGIGYVLWDSYYFLRYDLVIAAMISIGVLGLVSDLIVKLIMARVLHWQQGTTIQGTAK